MPDVGFVDLPKEKYPVVVQWFHPETKEVVYTVTIHAPAPGTKVVIKVPPLRKLLGHPVGVRATYGDGEVVVTPPILPS